MRKNKLAFTLAEVLVCITIIGVIMALSVHTIKIVKTSHTALTFFTFNNIREIVTEVYAGNIANEPGKGNNSVMMCRKTRQVGDMIDKYITILRPDFNIIYQKDDYGTTIIPRCNQIEALKTSEENHFCKRATDILNTSGAVNCDNLYEVDKSGTEPTILNLEPNNPNFVTTNGQRYYLSKWTYDANVSDNFGYRLLAVDLNGKSKPNIDKKEGVKIPDIVTFMIMDNGTVYPLGAAADNSTSQGRTVIYLNPKVKGYYFNPLNVQEGGVADNLPSDCYTYDESKTKVQTCNYSVIYVPNTTTNPANTTTFHTYRQAVCNARGEQELEYKTYCNGLSGNKNCPPSSDGRKFDMCRVELIKPMFRYNFK